MTRARPWKIAAIVSGVLVAVLVAGVVIAQSWCRIRECTYYGPHSNLLGVGERVVVSEDFRTAGDHSIAKAQTGIVQGGTSMGRRFVRPGSPN